MSHICRKHWSIPSYQVVSIIVTVSFTVPQTFVSRLQSVLNAAARLISNRRKFDHITPVLRDQLHWLSIRQRIDFKIAVFVCKAIHGRGPIYLSRTCNPVREVGARAHLRSAIRGDLEPGLVALGPNASVSRDRSFGTRCPRTFELRNCRWNVSNLC